MIFEGGLARSPQDDSHPGIRCSATCSGPGKEPQLSQLQNSKIPVPTFNNGHIYESSVQSILRIYNCGTWLNYTLAAMPFVTLSLQGMHFRCYFEDGRLWKSLGLKPEVNSETNCSLRKGCIKAEPNCCMVEALRKDQAARGPLKEETFHTTD